MVEMTFGQAEELFKQALRPFSFRHWDRRMTVTVIPMVNTNGRYAKFLHTWDVTDEDLKSSVIN